MSFFYTLKGDSMKIYLDLIILLNFFLDFLLLLGVSLLLKRNSSIKRIILASFFGGISILSLFIEIKSINLFILKIMISILMIIISFGFKNLKYTINNLIYLYLLSIILGGFLYFINDLFSYRNNGLIFYHNSYSINIILIVILSPIIIYIYIKNYRKLKNEYSKLYEVEITLLNNKKIMATGFLDTGNSLVDPYKKRPIILINKKLINNYNPKFILVPCYTINKKSIIKCFKIKSILINNKKLKKEILVGISDNNFDIDGAKILLQKNIIKGENINE